MIITFRIQYHTTWGESLCVCIDEKTVVELSTADGYCWQGQTDYHPDTPATFITYRYIVRRENHNIRQEFGMLCLLGMTAAIWCKTIGATFHRHPTGSVQPFAMRTHASRQTQYLKFHVTHASFSVSFAL